MRPASALAVALAAVAVIGCSDDSERQLPTAESPSFLTTGGPACSPTDLRKAAEALFGRRAAEVTVAGNFKPSTVNKPAVTPFAYQLFAAVAEYRNGDRPGAAWNADLIDEAAALSAHVTACADLAFSDNVGSNPTFADLTGAFTTALAEDGTYEVRGGAYNGLGPVVSHDAQAGLKPPASGYDTWLGGFALILGTTTGSFATEISGGGAYDWYMLRPLTSGALSGGLATVALCTPNSPPGLPDGTNSLRLQHLPVAEGGNIIPIPAGGASDIGLGCLPYDPLSQAGVVKRLFAAVQSLVLPQELHANVLGKGGPVGGLLGSFSPVEAVYPQQVIVTFTNQPVDGFVNVPIPVEVKVTGKLGTPWEGVIVQLSAVANNGNPLTLCGNSVETNAEGVASFPDFRVSKEGGLLVIASVVEPTADPDVTAYYTTAVADSSDRFNVRPTTTGQVACP